MNETRSSTENVQVPDIAALIAKHDPFNDPESAEFKASSAYIRTMIWMAQADKNAARTGDESFQYEDETVRALCHAWHEGFRRAKTVPAFWDLLNRVLAPNCKSLLGFDHIPRPQEVTA